MKELKSSCDTFAYQFFTNVNPLTKIRVNGKSFILGPSWAALASDFYKLAYHLDSRSSTHRNKLRNIIRHNPVGLLIYILEHCFDPKIVRLALWLRGMCRGTAGTKLVFEFWDYPDRQVRKEVVKALRKMHGWYELRQIADAADCDRIRNLAQPKLPKEFDLRKAQFLSGVEQKSLTVKMPQKMFVAESYGKETMHSPKPIEQIRMLLVRISKAVQGFAKVRWSG